MSERAELSALLQDAAEIEHGLTCKYLYAALSLRRTPGEGLTAHQLVSVMDWAQVLLLIARQEMEHLALVNNVLSAIGNAPHFSRPMMPTVVSSVPVPMALAPFSANLVTELLGWEGQFAMSPAPILVPVHPKHGTFQGPKRITALPLLYTRIAELLNSGGDGLFVGPVDSQVNGTELTLTFPRYKAGGGVYDFNLIGVVDTASAIAAINLVRTEGEGSQSGEDTSHFARLLRIQRELASVEQEAAASGQPFVPALALATNPILFRPDGRPDVVHITAQPARDIALVFCEAYEVLLLLLSRFFGHVGAETTADVSATIYVSFYPMMTMLIRPLAEVLTTLPAVEGSATPLAGPTFEFYSDVSILPSTDAANVIIGERLTAIHLALTEIAATPDAPARLATIADSVALMLRKWRSLIAASSMPTE